MELISKQKFEKARFREKRLCLACVTDENNLFRFLNCQVLSRRGLRLGSLFFHIEKQYFLFFVPPQKAKTD